MNAMTPQTKLRQQFRKELHSYYQMHGEKNGSPFEGTIYPPDIKDDVKLQKRVDDLSDFLSKKEGITLRHTPEIGNGRIQDRAQVAVDASGWVKATGKIALQAAVDSIVDPAIRLMTQQGLDNTDDQFFTAPSSNSGFFHPADEINEGGLALHTARVVAMGDHLSEFFGLSEREQDIMKAGLILHDTKKNGDPWKGRYKEEHGELAGKAIEQLDGPEDAKAGAAQIASNHMALWRKLDDGRRTENPALPDNKMDMIGSLADYLAARDDIYLDPKGVDKNFEPTTTMEERLTPNMLSGVVAREHKGPVPSSFPRGMKTKFENETLTLTINGKSYTGHANGNMDHETALVEFDNWSSEEGGKDDLKGFKVEANFWLMTGSRGGRVKLTKGEKSVPYAVYKPKN